MMKSILVLSILFLLASGLEAQTSSKIILSDYMGINTNVASYDNKYLSDLSKCVKWIREYHDWSQYEAANNYYKWDNITTQPQGWTWPEHTLFMNDCRKYGINVLIDVLGKPSWAGTSPIPITTGTGSNASDYIERLEFIGQLVARYGSKKISTTLLETADKATGLNYIKYYEDDNEPDYTWKSPLWTAANYAKYCNAAHDGFGVQTDAEHPLLGIKSVDPDAKHVMAGLASKDTTYVSNVLKASGGRIPFDVLNVHFYCTDMTNAYSPENETYGYEVGYRNFFKWKNRVVPGMPIWITEFGWDTYLNTSSRHSYTYAPALQQANYLLRSYMVLLKMGFEKAFLFMDTDTDSKNILQYASSGLLADKASLYAKKMSYYYLATMQNVLGKTEYSKTTSYKELSGDNEIYCLEFIQPLTLQKVYALWTRKPASNTDSGVKTSYTLNPGFQVGEVYSVVPADKDMDGDTIRPMVTDNAIALTLSETPQFVVVSESSTGSVVHPAGNLELNVYPNPANKEVQISLMVPEKQQVNLSAYTADGRLLQTMVNGLMEQGIHHYRFGSGQQPGSYLLSLNSTSGKIVRKVILLN
ncbi:MAG TPA: T9SS type A sorting domain-containing protein [Prolixibacteraceae bacterium]|jgi:hypothetical protein